MQNKSIWLKDIKTKSSPRLDKNIKVDILIIGGGITGISCAYFLKDAGLKIALVDASKIGYGTTCKTTGKITYLQGPIYQKIKSIYGLTTAKKYLKSQKYACDLIKNIIINNNIKCNYESNSSYLFSNSSLKKLKKEINVFNEMSENYILKKSLPITFPTKLAIKIEESAVFHPLKYLNNLKDICIKSNISIYENTPILSLFKEKDGYTAQTKKYIIKAKQVVLACSYPFFFKPGLFPFKTYLKKEFVCASITNEPKRFNAIDTSNEVNSIRYHSDNKDYVIYTSMSNKLGNNMKKKKKYDYLFWKNKTHFGENIKYYWFNYDIMTPDNMPIIGYYEKNNKNLLIGTGYNAWGMTNGTLAGKIISDLILKNKNEYIDLFDPNRNTNLKKITKTIDYNIKNITSFISSKINKKYSFYNKNIKIINENGKNIGIYTDENNIKHKVYITCPHMKCGLIFNEIDKTWDCPCHGSRFNIDGNAIKGPSIYDIKIK